MRFWVISLLAACGGDAVIEDGASGAGGVELEPPTGTPASCGDPVLTARFAQCHEAESETRCKATGGTWQVQNPNDAFCECPTGQRDCPCSTNDDCLDECMAPELSGGECPATGTCSVTSSNPGCYCSFYNGVPEPGCVD